jgi:hypothetical protein
MTAPVTITLTLSPESVAALADAIAARLTSAQPTTQRALLDKATLAHELACSVATIDRMSREGMPFVAVGRTRRYDPDACRAWCETRTRQPERPADTEPARGSVRLLTRGAK